MRDTWRDTYPWIASQHLVPAQSLDDLASTLAGLAADTVMENIGTLQVHLSSLEP